MKKILWSIFLLTVFVSCTDDDFSSDIVNRNVQEGQLNICVKLDDFKANEETQTRAYFSEDVDDGEMYEFHFDGPSEDIDDDGNVIQVTGDQFGICSMTSCFNVPLGVKEDFKSGANQKFDFKLSLKRIMNKGEKYVVYYPYNSGFLNMTGDLGFPKLQQNQEGLDDSYIIANNHTYFVSDAFVYEGGEIPVLNLHPLNSLLKLCLKLPAGSYDRIELVNIDGLKSFSAPSRLILTSMGLEVLKPSELTKKNCLTLELTDVAITKSKAKNPQNFYMSLFPQRTGDFFVKAIRSDGKVYYSKEKFNRDLRAGYCDVLNCTMTTTNYYEKENTENGIQYVDLGTGVYWAKMNVGALSPTELGNGYAWGEIISKDEMVYDDKNKWMWCGSNNDNWFQYVNSFYKRDYNKKTEYSWEQYKWNSNGKFVKYGEKCPITPIYGTIDATTLQPEDDVARYVYGGSWHIPSVKDMQDLRDKCFWETTTNYKGSGVAGFIVYKAKYTEDMCKYRNRNGENGVRTVGTYDVNSDVHIFLPSDVVREDTHSASYMTNETMYDKCIEDRWNLFCATLRVFDGKGQGKSQRCIDYVFVKDRPLSVQNVYRSMLVRPVCDK